MSASLRVAFFTLRDSYIDQGRCYHDRSNARLVQALSNQFDTSFITYQDVAPSLYYNHQIEARSLYVLPFRNTFLNGIIKSHKVWKVLKQAEGENDVLIIQFPFKSFFLTWFLKRPVVVHLCSNLLSASDNPRKYKGIFRLFSTLYARLLHLSNGIAFRKKNFHVITNGGELASLYRKFNPVQVISSSIFEREIIGDAEVKQRSGSFRVLFVGRPSLEKGFDTLLEAFAMLRECGSIQLTCVGFSKEEFEKLYPGSAHENRNIEFLGKIPFSQNLFSIYKSADVLVLPSRSEGTPRVLVEARAMGCPVIATSIGGIPASVVNKVDGLLFSPGDTKELAGLLVGLINDESWRQQLALNGLRRVRSITVEKFSDAFVKVINEIKLK